MILKEQVLRAGAFWAMPWRSVDEFQIVVNHNSIVANGGSSVGSLLAIRIVLAALNSISYVCHANGGKHMLTLGWLIE